MKMKNPTKNHMKLEYDFSGIRLQDSFIAPVDWNISVDLYAIERKSQQKSEVESKAGFAFQKIYFWLNTNLNGIIAVNTKSEYDFHLASMTSNLMMFCPENPGDDLLIRLLHAKMTSLASDDLIVGQIRLKSSDSILQYVYDCNDGDYKLPTDTVGYFEHYQCKDPAPWWTRDDGFCFELAAPVDDETKEMAEKIVDPLDEFYDLIQEYSAEKEPAKIIKVDKWKPRKV